VRPPPRPSPHDGAVEALRALKELQRSATKPRTQAINQLRSLLVTASNELRAPLRDLPQRDLLATCAGFRVAADDDSLPAIARLALRELAQRALFLQEQFSQVRLRLGRITKHTAPGLVALKGFGPDVAALLLAVGDNPQRLSSEEAVRLPLRPQPRASQQRQDKATPPQPRRRPASQRCPVAHYDGLPGQ